MNPETLTEYCLHFKGTNCDTPFGEQTLVFRVGGKIFALFGLDDFSFINLKCDPEEAVLLREEHEGITPGYHMSKKHWNSVLLDGSVPDDFLKKLIDNSYQLVFNSLSKKLQAEIAE